MKRLFDIVFIICTLPVTMPVFIVIALLIFCEGNGPIFFKSKRIGRFKKIFYILKFRTMYPEGDTRLNTVQAAEFKMNFKIHDDPRITPLGYWLRRTSLDELPQFINVLKGEMNLVGPRPKLPEEIDMFGEQADKLLSVPPGITGYWQIYRSSAASDAAMRDMELHYVQNRSFLKDLTILVFTPLKMLFFKNE